MCIPGDMIEPSSRLRACEGTVADILRIQTGRDGQRRKRAPHPGFQLDAGSKFQSKSSWSRSDTRFHGRRRGTRIEDIRAFSPPARRAGLRVGPAGAGPGFRHFPSGKSRPGLRSVASRQVAVLRRRQFSPRHRPPAPTAGGRAVPGDGIVMSLLAGSRRPLACPVPVLPPFHPDNGISARTEA